MNVFQHAYYMINVHLLLLVHTGTYTMSLRIPCAVLALILSIVPSGTAVPLNSFYSYGSAAGDSGLYPYYYYYYWNYYNYCFHCPVITLPTPFQFFGANYSTIQVSQFCVLSPPHAYSNEYTLAPIEVMLSVYTCKIIS